MIDGVIHNKPNGSPTNLFVREGCFAELSEFGTLVYNEVCGKFLSIGKSRYKGFPYYVVQLADGAERVNLWYAERSAKFKDLVLLLHGETFSELLLYAVGDASTGGTLYADGSRLTPAAIDLPKIKRCIDAGTKKAYCDYSNRLSMINELCAEINASNARAK